MTAGKPIKSLPLLYNRDGLAAVGLTFDTDWAPEGVLEILMRALSEHGLEATVFATNPSPALERAAAAGVVEIGIHPNFHEKSSHGKTIEEVVARCKGWFPQAMGARTHMLIQDSRIMLGLARQGIRYDSSTILFDHPNLQVFRTSYRGLVRVPYVWSDASHIINGRPFDLRSLWLESPGLKVLDLHPMLWYLNAATLSPYERAKTYHQDLTQVTMPDLDALITSGPGIRSLFHQLARMIEKRQLITYRLGELYELFLASCGDGAGEAMCLPHFFRAEEKA